MKSRAKSAEKRRLLDWLREVEACADFQNIFRAARIHTLREALAHLRSQGENMAISGLAFLYEKAGDIYKFDTGYWGSEEARKNPSLGNYLFCVCAMGPHRECNCCYAHATMVYGWTTDMWRTALPRLFCDEPSPRASTYLAWLRGQEAIFRLRSYQADVIEQMGTDRRVDMEQMLEGLGKAELAVKEAGR